MSIDESFNEESKRMEAEAKVWVPPMTEFPVGTACNFKTVNSHKSVTELCAEHPNLLEYVKGLEKREIERTSQLHIFSDEIASLRTRNRNLKTHINNAIMHLMTNIDIDENSMADSDAMNCLRRAVAEEALL